MKGSGWRTIALYLGVVVVAALLGTVVGELYANHRTKVQRLARDLELREYLTQNLDGIEVNGQFPPVPVWKPGGTEAHFIHELLPDGGVLIFVEAQCQSCYEAIDAVMAARQNAGPGARPALVVTNGDPTNLARYVADRGSDLRVYRDTKQVLLLQYRVLAYPSYFCLDSMGMVTDLGASKSDPEVFAELFTH